MVAESVDGLALLDVPVDTGGVSRGGDDVALVDETAAGEVPIVRSELFGGAHRLRLLELVDGAKVVQASARDHVVDRGLKRAGHDPGGSEGNGLDLVGGHGVPNDQLTVLGRGNELGGVSSPVHCINLTEVTLEDPASLGGGGPRVLGVFSRLVTVVGMSWSILDWRTLSI